MQVNDDDWVDYTNFLTGAARNAFKGRSDDIMFISNFAGGWESWAQVEICTKARRQVEFSGTGISKRDPTYRQASAAMFVREAKVYAKGDKGGEQRCDFLIEALQPRASGACKFFRFIELKCMTQGKLTEFVRAVEEDVKKVRNAAIKPEYLGPGGTQGWVVAIAVDEHKDGKSTKRMWDLGTKLKIVWEPCNLDDGRLIAWTWCGFTGGK